MRLLSLKNKDLATAFPAAVSAVKTIQAGTVLLDGEIVAVNAEGLPSFQALQSRGGSRWRILYYAFDVLSVEGEDLKALPLVKRKEKLKTILKRSSVRLSDELPGTPDGIVPTLKAEQIEGVIAKAGIPPTPHGHARWRGRNSSCRSRRNCDRRLQPGRRQLFVAPGRVPRDRQLMFAGKVRHGLTPALRRALVGALKPLVIKQCPFVNLPMNKSGHFAEGITRDDMQELRWVGPQIVAQVSFEWTSYGLLRHARFLSLRGDTDPEEVVREQRLNQRRCSLPNAGDWSAR